MKLCTAEDVGLKGVCCNCGGYSSDPIPGSVPALVYCSLECHDEWEDYLDRRNEESAWRLACCPRCGFDNSEHAPDCDAGEK